MFIRVSLLKRFFLSKDETVYLFLQYLHFPSKKDALFCHMILLQYPFWPLLASLFGLLSGYWVMKKQYLYFIIKQVY